MQLLWNMSKHVAGFEGKGLDVRPSVCLHVRKPVHPRKMPGQVQGQTKPELQQTGVCHRHAVLSTVNPHSLALSSICVHHVGPIHATDHVGPIHAAADPVGGRVPGLISGLLVGASSHCIHDCIPSLIHNHIPTPMVLATRSFSSTPSAMAILMASIFASIFASI